jgi:four helix bundle protein
MAVRKLEDLKVWIEARELAGIIYQLIKNFPEEEKYNITKHLRENARGAPANIAEGFYRFHYQDSIRFYLIARGCLGEIKNDLYLSFDQKYIDQEQLDRYIQKIEDIYILLNSLIKATKNLKNNHSYP